MILRLFWPFLTINSKLLSFSAKLTICVSLPPQIAATDKEIDELAYQLYGLTDDEIKVVKGVWFRRQQKIINYPNCGLFVLNRNFFVFGDSRDNPLKTGL